MRRVYFDNAASTPVDRRVVDAMLPYFTETYGNASSLHRHGKEAHAALDAARAGIAALLHAQPEEVVFTASGTEANNLAIKGAAFAHRHKGKHIIASVIEHDCVLNACAWLRSEGFALTHVPVDSDGFVDVKHVAEAIRPDTVLVSVMHANNEIGVIQPIGEIGRLCRQRGVLFHTDACQSFGKIPFDVTELAVDLATINAHKIHGPKGVGALYIRSGVRVTPWQHGGGQEFGMRSATENIAGIVGFAKAAALCAEERDAEHQRQAGLRDRIFETLLAEVPGAYVNGHRERRLPGNVNVGFSGLEGEAPKLLSELDERGISVSTGSACSSNAAGGRSSHVLRAIGRNPVEALGALRITLGRFTTEADVTSLLEALAASMKGLTSVWSGRATG